MTITSTDLRSALTATGLSTDDYELSAEGARLLTLPGSALDRTHVRLTVPPHVFERLRATGWEEVAAGFLGQGILLAGTRRPDAEIPQPTRVDSAETDDDPSGYRSAAAFGAHALVRTRTSGRRVGEQRFVWSAGIVALVVMLVGVLAQQQDASDPLGVVGLVVSTVGAAGLLLVVVAALIWLLRQYCGSRRIGADHGRSTVAAVTQVVVATGVPVLVAELAIALLGHGAGTTIGSLAILWAILITVLLASAMFRVSVGRAVLATLGTYLTYAVACALIYAAISFATR